jgi:hypothetical protein
MGQPPHNARKRTRVSQKQLVARTKNQPAPRSGKVQRTQTGVKKTPSTIAAERAQRAKVRLERLAERLQRPAKLPGVTPRKQVGGVIPRIYTPEGKQILRRELNLTPSARARLDAEEARLAREAQLSANKQFEESRRNRRVQNPMREPQVRRIVEQQLIQAIKEIQEAEKKNTRRQRKPLRPRGGMGIAPIMPGGGGLISRIK